MIKSVPARWVAMRRAVSPNGRAGPGLWSWGCGVREQDDDALAVAFEEADLEATRAIGQVVASLRDKYPDVAVTVRTSVGLVGEVLVERSNRAGLVVLAYPGPWTDLTWGHVAAHAKCPVLFVRPAHRDRQLCAPGAPGPTGTVSTSGG